MLPRLNVPATESAVTTRTTLAISTKSPTHTCSRREFITGVTLVHRREFPCPIGPELARSSPVFDQHLQVSKFVCYLGLGYPVQKLTHAWIGAVSNLLG